MARRSPHAGANEASSVADTTIQTAVLSPFPLINLSRSIGKKGGHLLGNATSLCLHGVVCAQAARGTAIGQMRVETGWVFMGHVSAHATADTRQESFPPTHHQWPMAFPRSACSQGEPWRQREVALPIKCPPFLPNNILKLNNGNAP